MGDLKAKNKNVFQITRQQMGGMMTMTLFRLRSISVIAWFGIVLLSARGATDIRIRPGAGDGISASPVTESTLYADDISAFLGTGSLVISTASEGADPGNILWLNGADVSWSTNQNLTLDANNDIFFAGTILADQGSVVFNAAHNISLSNRLETLGGSIELYATAGAISNAGGLLHCDVLMLSAGSWIGSVSNRLYTVADEIAFSAAGDVFLTETNAVIVAGLTQDSGSIDIATLNGNLVVGSVGADGGIRASGDVSLFASAIGTNISDFIQNRVVVSDGAGITVIAHNSIMQYADTSTLGAPVEYTTQNGSITMSDGASSESSGGDIFYTAAQNVQIGSLSAGAGAVFVTATEGKITSGGNSSIDLLGSSADLMAGSTIGTSETRLRTSLPMITISSGGDVYLSEADSITLGAMMIPGRFSLDTAGPVYFSGVAEINGNLSVDTTANGGTGGSISDTGAGQLIITSMAYLHAGTQGVSLDNASNNFNGSVNVSQADLGVELSDVGAISLDGITTAGGLTINSGGAVDFSSVATIGGNLSVDTSANGGTGGWISDSGAGLLLITGMAYLDAGTQGVTLDNDLNNFGGSVSVIQADAGLTIRDANTLSVADLSVASNNGVSVTVDAGILTVAGHVDAGMADVTLDARGGSIIKSGAGLVTAGLLTIDAVTGIDLLTTVATLDASVSGVGDIVINETDSITLLDVDTMDGSITIIAGGQVLALDVESNGHIAVTSGGPIVASNIRSTASNVVLHAASGNIEIGKIASSSSAGGTTLIANNGVVVPSSSYVISNRIDYGLYDMQDMGILIPGVTWLSVTNDTVRLFLQPMQSLDLASWTNAGNAVEWTLPVTSDKQFFRLRSSPE